ncbi:MAG: hypothetical protein AAF493_20925 [Pseudomonadota bacterium]
MTQMTVDPDATERLATTFGQSGVTRVRGCGNRAHTNHDMVLETRPLTAEHRGQLGCDYAPTSTVDAPVAMLSAWAGLDTGTDPVDFLYESNPDESSLMNPSLMNPSLMNPSLGRMWSAASVRPRSASLQSVAEPRSASPRRREWLVGTQ